MSKPIESRRIALHRKMVLRFPNFDGFATQYSTNISMTGMFVRSDEPQPPGTPVSFEFRMQDGAQLIRGKGWVVWARDQDDGPDKPAGMGVEFTDLDRESRRLIRWLILNQIPEGTEVFDVNAGAESPMRFGRTGRVGTPLWLGIVTGAALFLGLIALAYWWTQRPDLSRVPQVAASPGLLESGSARADLEVAAEVAERKPLSEPTDVLEQPSEPAAAPLAVSPESGEAREEDVQGEPPVEVPSLDGLETFVGSWARAWSNQDVPAYLGHYSAQFVPPDSLGRAEWEAQRGRRLTAPRQIRVAVARLGADFLTESRARVSFLQTYRSESYSDTVDKILEVEREADGWKIVHEYSN